MIIWQGNSVLDGAPIVAIATHNSSNRKTGDVVQVWIIRADVAPHDAVKSGDDVSICGMCPHRHFLGGICYVLPFQAPLSIYRAFERGSYDSMPLDYLDGKKVRLGAYGDPAAVPADVWRRVLANAAGVVGYTHQIKHRAFDAAVLDWCMVSADSPRQAARLRAKGFNTYRVAKPGQTSSRDETACPADTGVTCADCMACDGKSGSFYIPAHGARANRLTVQVKV